MELLANETLTNRKKQLEILFCIIQWCVCIQLFLKFIGVKTLENWGKEMKVILSIANFNDDIYFLYIDNQMHWSSHQSSGYGNNEIHLQINKKNYHWNIQILKNITRQLIIWQAILLIDIGEVNSLHTNNLFARGCHVKLDNHDIKLNKNFKSLLRSFNKKYFYVY